MAYKQNEISFQLTGENLVPKPAQQVQEDDEGCPASRRSGRWQRELDVNAANVAVGIRGRLAESRVHGRGTHAGLLPAKPADDELPPSAAATAAGNAERRPPVGRHPRERLVASAADAPRRGRQSATVVRRLVDGHEAEPHPNGPVRSPPSPPPPAAQPAPADGRRGGRRSRRRQLRHALPVAVRGDHEPRPPHITPPIIPTISHSLTRHGDCQYIKEV